MLLSVQKPKKALNRNDNWNENIDGKDKNKHKDRSDFQPPGRTLAPVAENGERNAKMGDIGPHVRPKPMEVIVEARHSEANIAWHRKRNENIQYMFNSDRRVHVGTLFLLRQLVKLNLVPAAGS